MAIKSLFQLHDNRLSNPLWAITIKGFCKPALCKAFARGFCKGFFIIAQKYYTQNVIHLSSSFFTYYKTACTKWSWICTKWSWILAFLHQVILNFYWLSVNNNVLELLIIAILSLFFLIVGWSFEKTISISFLHQVILNPSISPLLFNP